MRSSSHIFAALLLTIAAVGCGGAAAFSSRYPDNQPDQVALLLERLAAAPARDEPPIAIGVTTAPTKLFAYHLQTRRVLWQVPVAARFEPFLAGRTVVVQETGGIVGYDLDTGQRAFSTDAEDMTLNGADGVDDRVVFTMTRGLGTLADSEVVLVEGGSIAWRRSFERQAGSPALVGDAVLVPWGTQFLSALDITHGREFSRIRVRDGVIAHAFAYGGAVYLGSQHGVSRVTPSVGSGTLKGSGYLSLPAEELPGHPLLMRDVYLPKPTQAPDSAQHSIALAWQPAVDGIGLGMQDDNLYVIFYRFAFALDPQTLDLHWVYLHDADLVGAAAQAGGLAFGDENGDIGFVDARSGGLAWRARTELATNLMRFPRTTENASTAAEPPGPSALRTSLLSAAQDLDSRLVPARLLAVDLLSRMPDGEATSNLITVCDDSRVAPPVRKAACLALKRRTVGTEHLLAALERHAAYLQGTTSPPVGALARAAATQGDKRAVGPIVAHLKDPDTRSEDLPLVVMALRDLGDASAAEPLADFLKLYHADPIDEHLVRALELVPETLVRLSGPVAAPVLEVVAYDELGAVGLRERARIALETMQQATQAAEATDAKEQAAQEQQAAESAESMQAGPATPSRLTTAAVDSALLPVRDQLSACLKNSEKAAFQARVVLVVESGKVLMVSVMPDSLQGCVEPLVRAQAFPVTGAGTKERVIYTLKRF